MENEKIYNVLVIDDNFMVRHNYKLILEKHGFGFIESSRGEDGLEKLKQHEISLILLDLMMPTMSGLDFMEVARAKYKNDLPPVLVCSAEADVPTIKKMVEFGIAGYLLKPVDANILLNKLKQMFPDMGRKQV